MGRPKFKLVDISKLQPSQPEASVPEDIAKVSEPLDVEEPAAVLSSPAIISPEELVESTPSSAEVGDDENLLDLDGFGPMMM